MTTRRSTTERAAIRPGLVQVGAAILVAAIAVCALWLSTTVLDIGDGSSTDVDAVLHPVVALGRGWS